MNAQKQNARKRRGLFFKGLLLVLLVGMISGYFALIANPGTRYIITDGDTVTSLSSTATDVTEVLAQAGISMSDSDQVVTSRRGGVTDIVIHRQSSEGDFSSQETLLSAQPSAAPTSKSAPDQREKTPQIAPPVTEADSGERTIGETESAVEIGQEPVEEKTQGSSDSSGDAPAAPEEPAYDKPSYDYDEPVYDEPSYNDEASSGYATAAYEEPEEPYYEEPYYEEPAYEPPAASGDYITTSSGEVIYYVDVLSVEATAYTGGGTTATGTPARYGEIAVDPSYIPYGTVLYIVSDDGRWIYGVATAEDCGGAINGNIIDLYFDDYDTCIQFGRRNCTAYVISWG